MTSPTFRFGLTSLCVLALGAHVFGYGREGHEIAGEIAEEWLHGSNAEKHVRALLGQDSLAVAATWADRIRGGEIDDDAKFFFAPGTGNDVTHAERHYCDVPIDVGVYKLGGVGTKKGVDIVQSIKLCIRILQHKEKPVPAGWNDKIALMLLAHYIGDLHQPLHVGSVYIANGAFMNPQAPNAPKYEDTHGGNWLTYPMHNRDTGHSSGKQDNLHYYWDTTAVLHAMGAETDPLKFAAVLRREMQPAPTWGASGDPVDWAEKWANETLKLSKEAFAGVKISNRHELAGRDGAMHPQWDVTGMRADYDDFATKAVKTELARSGYRLAKVLGAIWP